LKEDHLPNQAEHHEGEESEEETSWVEISIIEKILYVIDIP